LRDAVGLRLEEAPGAAWTTRSRSPFRDDLSSGAPLTEHEPLLPSRPGDPCLVGLPHMVDRAYVRERSLVKAPLATLERSQLPAQFEPIDAQFGGSAAPRLIHLARWRGRLVI
jgi:hypothetical protein